jgi:hypothetical protein
VSTPADAEDVAATQAGVSDGAAARLLVREALDALPHDSFEARIKLTGDYRDDRTIVAQHKVVNGSRWTYLEVVGPEPLIGVRFLFKERADQPPEQYMRYLAATLPVLIARETRAEPFLGSSYAIVDMSEPELDAFTYEMLGEDTAAGRTCKLVEAVPKIPADAVYGKVVHCIDPGTKVVVMRRFYDAKGNPTKEWTATKIEQIDGSWTIMNHQMKDTKRESVSRIGIEKIEYGVEIPDSVFALEHLSRK